MTLCVYFSCILIVRLVLCPENCQESDRFLFLHSVFLPSLQVSVGLILAKVSTMRVTIPLDLSNPPSLLSL